MTKHFYSNGKLLLTGEYVVLDGALALAVPTQYGQTLTVVPIDKPEIIWTSCDFNNNTWFKSIFKIKNDSFTSQTHCKTSARLLQILDVAKQLNPSFFDTETGFKIKSKLEFPQNWGLGSSSTLLNNIAQWTNVDAYKLLDLTFGGSGYDIACAKNNKAITYQLKRNLNEIDVVNFNPTFSDKLFFIHLNKKQNSREAIKHYNLNKDNIKDAIEIINSITLKMLKCTSLIDFENLIKAHERIISKITNQDTVKNKMFKDYKGTIKSLGAWGGDFVLATGSKKDMEYFNNKGFKTIINYKNMVL
ncbi:MAG: GHMP kinase [Flavobacteriaceae bacterium]|nr:GHMP kinase [Flavobacteriaceae bacterium]